MKKLEFTLVRHSFTNDSTIGSLYLNNKFICFTLEDKDRKLFHSHSIGIINKVKVMGETAIPYGTYHMIYSYSAKFQRKLPRLLNVKGWEGILIHAGNDKNDSRGCILIGLNFTKDRIYFSTKATELLFGIIENAVTQGATMTITITSQNQTPINL